MPIMFITFNVPQVSWNSIFTFLWVSCTLNFVIPDCGIWITYIQDLPPSLTLWHMIFGFFLFLAMIRNDRIEASITFISYTCMYICVCSYPQITVMFPTFVAQFGLDLCFHSSQGSLVYWLTNSSLTLIQVCTIIMFCVSNIKMPWNPLTFWWRICY